MNTIQLHADWTRRCVIDSNSLPWQASPSPLVERRMLERDGGEVARATSVVRYAPGARFDAHRHELGEEILVLEGTFSDASGDYGPGSYLRNPPGTTHAPWSVEGCTLFVKLRYMDADDRLQLAIDTRRAQWVPGVAAGLTVLALASVGTTHTALVRWAPGTRFQPHRHYGGEEIFVLEGVFSDEFGDYPAGHWIRSPHLSQHQPFSQEGCLILVKTGHLIAEPMQ
jgi:anti-sigma factor ChrR (cupin superfamily)